MAGESAFAARSPLNARLDAKGFLQLTIWFVLVVGAYMLATYLVNKGKTAAAQATGKITAGGVSNPFLSDGA